MRINVHVVRAFADDAAPGSLTGVVPQAALLSEEQMRQVAQQLDVSHTAFLYPPHHPVHDVKVRFLTRHAELKNCAHATIAAQYWRTMQEKTSNKQVVKQETNAGVQDVWIRGAGEAATVWFRQNAVAQRDVAPEVMSALTEALQLSAADLHPVYPVRMASPGAFRFLVPVASFQQVQALQPDQDQLASVCRETNTIGCFVFAVEESSGPWIAQGRMFAPAVGVPEDRVNGNSAGCLGAYLLDVDGRSQFRLAVKQGHRFGVPATVWVEARRKDTHIETLVGGSARYAGSHTVVL